MVRSHTSRYRGVQAQEVHVILDGARSLTPCQFLKPRGQIKEAKGGMDVEGTKNLSNLPDRCPIQGAFFRARYCV